jgi:hypothetical protein
MINCPECGCTQVAAETRTWINYGGSDDEPFFDEEDAAYCEPLPGGAAVCRDCQHQWTIPGADVTSS